MLWIWKLWEKMGKFSRKMPNCFAENWRKLPNLVISI
jgi:hypothetical protein